MTLLWNFPRMPPLSNTRCSTRTRTASNFLVLLCVTGSTFFSSVASPPPTQPSTTVKVSSTTPLFATTSSATLILLQSSQPNEIDHHNHNHQTTSGVHHHGHSSSAQSSSEGSPVTSPFPERPQARHLAHPSKPDFHRYNQVAGAQNSPGSPSSPGIWNRRWMSPLKLLVADILGREELRTRHIPDICPFNTTCPTGINAFQSVQKIVPNGCGPEGLNTARLFASNDRLTRCCDEHDMCYGTCGTLKKTCDDKFRLCLEAACRNRNRSGVSKAIGESGETDGGMHNIPSRVLVDLVMDRTGSTSCILASNAFSLATRALGCAAFQDAQSLGCACPIVNTNQKNSQSSL